MNNSHRPRRRPRRAAPTRRRRVSRQQAAAIDYRAPHTLTPYLTATGKIKTRTQTGLSRRDQRGLALAVKRARELALLPYRTEAPHHDRGDRR